MSKKENKYTVEKSSESARMTITQKPTIDDAKVWIGSSAQWRITEMETGVVVAQSETIPEIFDRGRDVTSDTSYVAVVKTYNQTGYRG